jgi:hypothetical protein
MNESVSGLRVRATGSRTLNLRPGVGPWEQREPAPSTLHSTVGPCPLPPSGYSPLRMEKQDRSLTHPPPFGILPSSEGETEPVANAGGTGGAESFVPSPREARRAECWGRWIRPQAGDGGGTERRGLDACWGVPGGHPPAVITVGPCPPPPFGVLPPSEGETDRSRDAGGTGGPRVLFPPLGRPGGSECWGRWIRPQAGDGGGTERRGSGACLGGAGGSSPCSHHNRTVPPSPLRGTPPFGGRNRTGRRTPCYLIADAR